MFHCITRARRAHSSNPTTARPGPRRLAAVAAVVITALAPGLARADLDVVTTVPDLAAIAEAIGGDRVEVLALSRHTQDPHWVDAKPSLTLAVNKAEMLVAVGLELEVGWLPTLQTGARNRAVQRGAKGYLECSEFVSVMGVPKGKVDRSQGDIHPSGNPHYLYDPRRALRCARGIADRMAALDPEHADDYRAGYRRFESQLEGARDEWEGRLARLRGMKVITYHESWSYFADWLGLEVVGVLEPKPGSPPSPRHVALLLRRGRAEGVTAVIQESYYPSKTSKLVADKLGAELVELPGGTDHLDGESYLEHLGEMLSALERAFQ